VVAQKGSTTSLSRVTWFETRIPGSLQGLVFVVDDVRATCGELRAEGILFDFAPSEMPGGLQAVFRDPDGTGSLSQVGRDRESPIPGEGYSLLAPTG
jgi:catechol 2,3-dioxygenase-like lactoylglutathione lyase family enzyme